MYTQCILSITQTVTRYFAIFLYFFVIHLSPRYFFEKDVKTCPFYGYIFMRYIEIKIDQRVLRSMKTITHWRVQMQSPRIISTIYHRCNAINSYSKFVFIQKFKRSIFFWCGKSCFWFTAMSNESFECIKPESEH